MRWEHFEVLRLGIGRKLETNRMFAIWRVDAPWQPVTKKVGSAAAEEKSIGNEDAKKTDEL